MIPSAGERDLTRAWCWQAKGVTLTARVRTQAGALLTQAALTSIKRYVYDLDNDGANVENGTAVTIASSVYDALQAAAADLALWKRDGVQVDSTGWNFKDVVPAASLPKGVSGTQPYRRYRVEYVFDPVSGEDFVVAYELYARNLYSVAEA